MKRKILKKIFRTRKGTLQILLGSLGLTFGLLMIMISFQIYLHVDAILSERNQQSDYLIISKKIGLENTLTMSRATFSKNEIQDLKRQSFIDKISPFISNQFAIWVVAKQETERTTAFQLKTELFFEAVEDSVMDVLPEEWHWQPGDSLIPIILSQDILDLYNFGYALSKGLPQITPELSRLLKFKLTAYGPQGRAVFSGKVVGFSQRIPSILVPQSFLSWANKNIGENIETETSRLMIKVNNPSDPELEKYLNQKNLQVNQDRLQASKAGGIIKVVMAVISTIGILFIVLALIVFVSNFKLIIAESQPDIILLFQLGYTVNTLRNYIGRFILFIFLSITVLVSTTFYLVSLQVKDFLTQNGLVVQQTSQSTVWVVMFLFLMVIFLVNIASLSRTLSRYA